MNKAHLDPDILTLLRSVFQVEEHIGGLAGGTFVDYLAQAGERSQ